MKIKNCTEEFQKIFWKNKSVKQNKKKDIETLIKERNKRNLEKKTEIDFILEDLVSSKAITGLNNNSKSKLEDYYNNVKKSKHSKQHIIKILGENNKTDDISDRTNPDSEQRLRKATDVSDVNEIVLHDIMRSPTRVRTIKVIKTVKFEKFISPVSEKNLKTEDLDWNTFSSTQINTEGGDKISSIPINNSYTNKYESMLKSKKLLSKLENYEKLCKKVKDQAIAKVEEYDRKRTFLKNKYKMVCETYFPYNT